MKKRLNKLIALVVIIVGGFFAFQNQSSKHYKQNVFNLEDYFSLKKSGEIITIKAKVINILSDDSDGYRHQRLILKVGERTLLLAHNIDVAKRIPVKKGDTIEVRGQYEWNEKGGVIHWTHKDKRNKHPHGWIKHNNKTYQ